MLKEFKDFLARGNVVDLAVAVVIGAAFGKIITSLVEGIIMPPIGLLLGKVDFASLFLVLDHSKGAPVSLADAKAKGLTPCSKCKPDVTTKVKPNNGGNAPVQGTAPSKPVGPQTPPPSKGKPAGGKAPVKNN